MKSRFFRALKVLRYRVLLRYLEYSHNGAQNLLIDSFAGIDLVQADDEKHQLALLKIIQNAQKIHKQSLDAYLDAINRFNVLLDEKPMSEPPGALFLKFAEFFYSKRFFESVARPIISDMREEYNEALFQNYIWKARWVRIRGTYSFFAAIGLDRAFAFVSFFIKAWKSVN